MTNDTLADARALLARWLVWACGQQGASPFQDTRDFLSTPPTSTDERKDVLEEVLQRPSEQDVETMLSRKWLDPECLHDGCQSLVWKRKYERCDAERDKFMWQVRDTCTRAEKAEVELDAALATIRALTPNPTIDDHGGEGTR